jgi:hypothetical protein
MKSVLLAGIIFRTVWESFKLGWDIGEEILNKFNEKMED